MLPMQTNNTLTIAFAFASFRRCSRLNVNGARNTLMIDQINLAATHVAF